MTVSTATAAEQSGASQRQLRHWVALGYLEPTRRSDKTGSGYELCWSSDQIAKARRMAILVTLGMTPALAELVARCAPMPYSSGVELNRRTFQIGHDTVVDIGLVTRRQPDE